MRSTDIVSTTGDQVVYVVLAEERLSRRGRLAAVLLALATLALVGLGSTWAGIPPVITGQSPVLAAGPDQVIEALPVACDGPSTHLAWNSTTYDSVELTVVGDRVVAPGDRVGCTVSVTNTGPTAAVLTVSFSPVHLAVGAVNPDLAEDLYFFWDADGVGGTERFDTVMALGGDVTEVLVLDGDVVQVEVGFTMPAGVTGQQRGGLDSTQLSFEVTVQLSESTHSSPPTTGPPTSPPPTGPGPSSPPTGTGGSGADQGGSGQAGPGQAGAGQADRGQADRGRAGPGLRLPRTGAEVAGVVAVAGALLTTGAVIWIVARRRRDRRDPSTLVETR